jgi:polyisoprenoid-binding protein YceI
MTKYTVDASHSSIGFEVKHMMVSKVKGTFDEFAADVQATDLADLTTADITFDIKVASVNTRNADRDGHLRSADFFDVENFENISFKSTSISGADEDFNVTGDLTIKDVTKPVTFKVEYGGKGTNPWGAEVYGFEAETKINREEFGLTWNAALETGGVLVGKDIKIKVELELNPAAE